MTVGVTCSVTLSVTVGLTAGLGNLPVRHMAAVLSRLQMIRYSIKIITYLIGLISSTNMSIQTTTIIIIIKNYY